MRSLMRDLHSSDSDDSLTQRQTRTLKPSRFARAQLKPTPSQTQSNLRTVPSRGLTRSQSKDDTRVRPVRAKHLRSHTISTFSSLTLNPSVVRQARARRKSSLRRKKEEAILREESDSDVDSIDYEASARLTQTVAREYSFTTEQKATYAELSINHARRASGGDHSTEPSISDDLDSLSQPTNMAQPAAELEEASAQLQPSEQHVMVRNLDTGEMVPLLSLQQQIYRALVRMRPASPKSATQPTTPESTLSTSTMPSPHTNQQPRNPHSASKANVGVVYKARTHTSEPVSATDTLLRANTRSALPLSQHVVAQAARPSSKTSQAARAAVALISSSPSHSRGPSRPSSLDSLDAACAPDLNPNQPCKTTDNSSAHPTPEGPAHPIQRSTPKPAPFPDMAAHAADSDNSATSGNEVANMSSGSGGGPLLGRPDSQADIMTRMRNARARTKQARSRANGRVVVSHGKVRQVKDGKTLEVNKNHNEADVDPSDRSTLVATQTRNHAPSQEYDSDCLNNPQFATLKRVLNEKPKRKGAAPAIKKKIARSIKKNRKLRNILSSSRRSAEANALRAMNADAVWSPHQK